MKQNYSYLHILRVIATLSVILIHTSSGGIFESTEGYPLYISQTLQSTQWWSVPLFLIISGALFFSPEKNIDYKVLFSKYIKRIVLALVLFGLPMILSEIFLEHRNENPFYILLTSLKKLITGNSWAHMWYLYMLIGLYLITPVVKPFLNTAKSKDIRTALFVLFTLSSLLPLLQLYGVEINSYLIISSPYVFIYMLGYYLQWRVDYSKHKRNTLLATLLIITSLASIFARNLYGINTNCYADPASIFIAASLFILLKQLCAKSTIAEKLSPYCFGVYLVHAIFINLFYKILKLSPLTTLESLPLTVSIPLYFAMFSVLSFTATYALMKIPFLKKHIL
jgi:surface polysaccharide O-acyltransferase-like enzyme